MSIASNLNSLINTLPKKVTLVAVSKTKPVAVILEAYKTGQRIFGENKVQELLEKHQQLPEDIQWHMIGHLQRNKVKYIAPFVSLIHGVDSLKLLLEIDKQAATSKRVINCLIQLNISQEVTKHGMVYSDFKDMISGKEFQQLKNIKILGLMGMASFTKETAKIRSEFKLLANCFKDLERLTSSQISPQILSMGMSGDYEIAMEEGSNMIRVGSAIFGKRNYL